MRITSSTPYSQLQPYESILTAESVQELKAAAEAHFKSCYDLTIDEFFGVIGGNLSLLGDMSRPSVLQVYWTKRFADFCEEFTRACERMTIKDPTQEHLHEGCLKIEPQEAMLIFTREYFGLRSFFEAGERTIGEYLTARKDRYNEAVFRRNSEAEQKRKLKARK